jgi:hypothetical protein
MSIVQIRQDVCMRKKGVFIIPKIYYGNKHHVCLRHSPFTVFFFIYLDLGRTRFDNVQDLGRTMDRDRIMVYFFIG